MQVGIDIIEISRIVEAAKKNPKFIEKVLTKEEQELYQSYKPKRQATFLAGRFSAKEAYSKMLGTGMGQIWFKDICIMPDDKGRPKVIKGPVLDVSVSISHSKDFANAVVVTNLTEEEIDEQLEAYLVKRKEEDLGS